jgi:hypothetical protein
MPGQDQGLPSIAMDQCLHEAASAARTIALQMLEERGRGAVLVGVARVDEALERLLQAVMAPDTERDDRLFRPDAPLGSLGAKVALARRLGLIDEAVERSLQTLRRVRNAFAHSTASATLADSAHASRLSQAYDAARENPLWCPLATVLDRQPTNDGNQLDPALRDYILLITVLVAFLEAATQKLHMFQPEVVMGFSGMTSGIN